MIEHNSSSKIINSNLQLSAKEYIALMTLNTYSQVARYDKALAEKTLFLDLNENGNIDVFEKEQIKILYKQNENRGQTKTTYNAYWTSPFIDTSLYKNPMEESIINLKKQNRQKYLTKTRNEFLEEIKQKGIELETSPSKFESLSLEKVINEYYKNNNFKDNKIAIENYAKDLIAHYKNEGVYCNDIEENLKNVANLTHVLDQQKYLKYYTQKLQRRLKIIRTNNSYNQYLENFETSLKGFLKKTEYSKKIIEILKNKLDRLNNYYNETKELSTLEIQDNNSKLDFFANLKEEFRNEIKQYFKVDGLETDLCKNIIETMTTCLEDITEVLNCPEENIYLNAALKLKQSIYNKKSSANNLFIKPDGKFENITFQQGSIGDCWFLSTIGALAETENGRKKLSELIEINHEKQCAYVKFASVDKPYEIPFEQIKYSTELSEGDSDVRLLEIALEKYILEHPDAVNLLKAQANDSIESPIDGGTARYALAIMFDENVSAIKYADTSIVNQIANFAEKEKNINISGFLDALGFKCSQTDANYYSNAETIRNSLNAGKVVSVMRTSILKKEKVSLENGYRPSPDHVCFVSKVDNEGNIYIKDPADTAKEYKFNQQEFRKTFHLVGHTDITNEPDFNLSEAGKKLLERVPNFLHSFICKSQDSLKEEDFNILFNFLANLKKDPEVKEILENYCIDIAQQYFEATLSSQNFIDKNSCKYISKIGCDFTKEVINSKHGKNFTKNLYSIIKGQNCSYGEMIYSALSMIGDNSDLLLDFAQMPQIACRVGFNVTKNWVEKNVGDGFIGKCLSYTSGAIAGTVTGIVGSVVSVAVTAGSLLTKGYNEVCKGVKWAGNKIKQAGKWIGNKAKQACRAIANFFGF